MKYIPAISFCRKILSILSHVWNLIDCYCKFQSEISDHYMFSQNWIFFLQGVSEPNSGDLLMPYVSYYEYFTTEYLYQDTYRNIVINISVK